VEELAQLRFDRTVAGLSPATFVHQVLVEDLSVGCVVVGTGFRFGADRTGDVDTLRALGRKGFETIEVPALEDEGGRVSSSRIRAALLRGDLKGAERWLGRPYEIEGRVLHGDHRGWSLGFPTANIDLEGVSALGHGVYAADGLIEGEVSYRRAAVNLGVRPTFDGAEPRLEAHFPGLSGELYGLTVRLVFLARLRDERQFATVDDLVLQLGADVRAAQGVPHS
jgi:riboflavin kinase/FMN adenylyltransferase